MFGKQKNTPQIDSAAAKGINFEVSIADIAKRSEKRAWMIAWVAIFMVLIMLGVFIYILPLKKEVPYLIMADAFTGQATVATLRGDFSSPKSITQSEALNRSNVAQYIIGRESFDSAMMALRDWTLINSMSSSNVRAGYAAIHAADNLESPYKIYGKDRSIRVKILSIQLDQRGQGEQCPQERDCPLPALDLQQEERCDRTARQQDRAARVHLQSQSGDGREAAIRQSAWFSGHRIHRGQRLRAVAARRSSRRSAATARRRLPGAAWRAALSCRSAYSRSAGSGSAYPRSAGSRLSGRA